MGEILQILPNIHQSRWKKKTDFYTLFLVFSKHLSKFPLASENRQTANSLLVEFSNQINEFVKSEAIDKKQLPTLVTDYGAGIRASTDLGSRKRRFEALEKHLAPVLKST